MKTFVITFSKEFMKGHPRAGEPTNFVESIVNGSKKHTIRTNYGYWKKIVDQVNKGEAILSCRVWTGKPYRSKQYEFAEFTKLGFQACCVSPENEVVLIEGAKLEDLRFANDVEKNDGLSDFDFWSWFPKEVNGCIIHFSDLRY